MVMYEKSSSNHWVISPHGDKDHRTTKVEPKFRKVMIGVAGVAIHYVVAVYVRWDLYPFPAVTYALACGGRQTTEVHPLQDDAEVTCRLCRAHLGLPAMSYSWATETERRVARPHPNLRSHQAQCVRCSRLAMRGSSQP